MVLKKRAAGKETKNFHMVKLHHWPAHLCHTEDNDTFAKGKCCNMIYVSAVTQSTNNVYILQQDVR